jgi:hypothetical protein
MWRNTEKLQGSYNINRTTGTVSNADETQFEDLWDLLWYAGLSVTTQQSEGTNCMKYCEVYYYYEAPPGDRGCRAYAVVCENQVLACRGNDYEHGLKPLADIKWQPIHNDLWNCIGVPRQMRTDQEIVNISLNQGFEQTELFLRPPRLVGQGAGQFPLTQLNPWPNGHIKVPGDPSQIKLLDFPNVRGDLQTESADSKNRIQRATRITNISKGMVDPGMGDGAKTAQGIAFMTDATSRAAAFKTLFHEEIGIAPQLMQEASIIQQTIEDGTVINIGDVNETLKRAGFKGDRLPIRSADLAGEWEFYAVGSSKTQEPAVVANNMTKFWQPVLQDPEHGKLFDRMAIYADAHEMIFHRPISKYLKGEQALQQTLANAKPPVPPQMLPKFKDLDTAAKDAVKDRLQLPTTGVSADDEKEAGKTVGKLAVEHLSPPKQNRFMPKRGQPQPVA